MTAIHDITRIDIMSAFVASSYGKLTPHLMKYSATFADGQLQVRIVVLQETTDEELDTVFEIQGDMIGHLGGTGGFEVVKAASVSEAKESPALPVLLYWAHALDVGR
jgi:hypothetical protein